MPSSGGSSWPRDRTHVSYVSFIGRCVLYYYHYPVCSKTKYKFKKNKLKVKRYNGIDCTLCQIVKDWSALPEALPCDTGLTFISAYDKKPYTYFTVPVVPFFTFSKCRVQFSSVAQLCPTLCNPMDCSMPGFLVYHQLLELDQTHVHWVGDAIQPSHPLSSPCPPAFNLSQNHGLFQWVGSSHQVAKVLEFQLQYQSFQWIFRTDFL